MVGLYISPRAETQARVWNSGDQHPGGEVLGSVPAAERREGVWAAVQVRAPDLESHSQGSHSCSQHGLDHPLVFSGLSFL